MKTRKGKGFFSISAVAKMFAIHQQTIRLYEKQGLITPKRSDGNTRLFSEEDVERLEEIVYLTHQLGINLAGVEMIFKLKKQVKKMQREMNQLFKTTHEQLEQEVKASEEMVRSSARQLAQLKQQADIQRIGIHKDKGDKKAKEEEKKDAWDIEYENE